MNSPTVKLRDTRKPGHCWQDNELYDCFQPVIGPLAVGVYARITRECFGATVTVSLRELAELTGLSKSAVQRAMAVLELVGMVTARRGAAKRSPEYDLADLKELAIGYGSEFDAKRCSYVLREAARERLRAEVAALEKRMQGKPCREPRGVPQGDTEGRPDGVVGVPQRDSGVPQEGQWCPSEGQNGDCIKNDKKARKQNNTPLPPSQASGVRCEARGEDEDGKRDPGDGGDTQRDHGDLDAAGDGAAAGGAGAVPEAGDGGEQAGAGGGLREAAGVAAGQDVTALARGSDEFRAVAFRAAWQGVLQDLHKAIVNPSLPPSVARRLGNGQDWERYFARLEFLAPDARTGGLMVRAPDPRAAQAGMEKYAKRIHAAMRSYFGREMPVTLVDSA